MSGKKIHITAAVSLRVNTAPVEKLSKENVRFKSISTAYSIDYDRQLQLELREQLDEYNCFVDKLFSTAYSLLMKKPRLRQDIARVQDVCLRNIQNGKIRHD